MTHNSSVLNVQDGCCINADTDFLNPGRIRPWPFLSMIRRLQSFPRMTVTELASYIMAGMAVFLTWLATS